MYHASYVNFLPIAINVQCAWFMVALGNHMNRVNQVVPYNMDLVESGA